MIDTPTRDVSEVGAEVARDQWAAAAREALERTAHTYHSTITYTELAHFVQDQTGIHTTQLMHYWVGSVLGRVMRACNERGEPNLSSLCVDSKGSVGASYAAELRRLTDKVIEDGDAHAALERFACYKHHGAKLPAGGGRPALTDQLKASRDRLRAKNPPLPKMCPKCYIALPATGVCDNCS